MRSEHFSGSLDELETDLVVTTLFRNERPPRGATGLIDWRLNGFLSRLILNGTLTGKDKEITLIPLHRRLPARRVLIVGLGAPEHFTLAQSRHLAYRVGKAIAGMKAIDVALAFPPAYDEKIQGDTERSIFDALVQASLPNDLFLRWLPISERKPAKKTASPKEARAKTA
jgi:hypothetical protein